MSAAHIAAIPPAACVGQLAHLLDRYQGEGITVEGDGMVTAFLRELIWQLCRLLDRLVGFVERCLDLLVKLLQFMFQTFQLILLGPCLSCYPLILGNILVQRLVTFLVLLDIAGNLFESLHTIAHGTQSVVLAHGQLAVVMLVLVVTFQVELIPCIDLLPHLLIPHVDGVHLQREAIDITHLPVFIADGTPGILQGFTHAFDIVGSVCRKLLDSRHLQTWQYSPVFDVFGSFLEFVIVLGHVLDDGLILLHLLLGHLHTPFCLTTGLHIGLAL